MKIGKNSMSIAVGRDHANDVYLGQATVYTVGNFVTADNETFCTEDGDSFNVKELYG